MPYFPLEKLLLVHIPRTGGTSLEWMFRNGLSSVSADEKTDPPPEKMQLYTEWKNFYVDKLTPVPVSLQHLTFAEIHQFFPEFVTQADKIISVVRHPYDRFISEYFYLRYVIMNPERDPVPKCYLDHQKRYGFEMEDCMHLVDINKFIPWIYQKVKQNKYFLDGHFRTQTEFLNGLQAAPHFQHFPFEKLAEVISFLRQICPTMSPKDRPKKREHKYPVHDSVEITADNLFLLHQWYSEDFINFNFKKDQLEFGKMSIVVVNV